MEFEYLCSSLSHKCTLTILFLIADGRFWKRYFRNLQFFKNQLSKFTASDVLEQLFNDDSDFSGSDSDGKKIKISTLIGEHSYFERGRDFGGKFSGSGFIVKALYIYC